ncbi:MAG: ADP-ribose diphosphatase [Parasphingorhabdus sp.]|jgi:ADP-ribose diphosphatase
MKPEIKRRRTVAESRLFTIQQVDLKFSNGIEATFEQLTGIGQGGVLVVPILDKDTILLVEEYALGVDRYELGFVKGLIDKDESAQQAAVRELEEEVSYTATSIHNVGDYSVMPAYSNFHHHIVIVENLTPKSRTGDEPEPLKLVPWPISELEQLHKHPRFTDARCHLALFLLSNFLQSRVSHV